MGSTGADPASQSVLGMGLAGLRVGFRHPNPTEVNLALNLHLSLPVW